MLRKLVLISSLTALIFLSLFPRSIEVLNGNPIFEIDQGRDMLAVKSIVVDKKLTLIGAELGAGQAGLQYLFHGPGYFYTMAIPFILFNGHPIGGVYLMLLFSLSAISFGMYLAYKLFGLKEAFILGFLIAICPFFIGQSRFYENHFPSTFLILLVFYFVYRFTKNLKNKKFVFLSALFSGGIYNFEFALAVPMYISLFAYCLFLYKKKVPSVVPHLILGGLIGFMPMLAFEFRHGFMGIKSVFTYLFNYSPGESSISLLTHARNIINLLIFNFSDSFAGRLVLPVKLVLPVFIGLTVFVFYKEKDRIVKNFFTYIILLFPVNFLVFMFLRNIVFQHYIIDLALANLILFAYVLSRLWKPGYLKLASVVFLYFLFLVFVGAQNAYTVSRHDYYDYGGSHKLKAKIEALDFIYKDAGGKPFNLLVFYPPIYTYPYDYLIWWHGGKKYGYLPGNEKKDVFYLLIEKDAEKPWTYKGWLETVIKTGDVEFTKTLPRSGLIVEKRRLN